MADTYHTPPSPRSEDEKTTRDLHTKPKGVGTGDAPQLETGRTSGWAAWFGGPGTKVGPRIGPVLPSISGSDGSESDDSTEAILQRLRDSESGASIQYRTCSWQKTAALLFSEYICLAIMSFPWSYHILGLVPGLILTVVVAALVLYTSLVVWEFCLRHPEVRDVCDVGQMLFWGQKWAWWFTAIMFLLNNTFIQALHILVGAKYLNTMTAANDNISCRTVSFGAVMLVISFVASLPRTFSVLAKLGTASAFFTFISVLLAAVFAGVQGHPAGYDPRPSYVNALGATVIGGEPIVNIIPPVGTTFVLGMSAFLNISYTFIGQITLPSFIAEMKDPRDFPKALWACTIGEIIVFSVVGAVVYAFVGDQYMTAPAFGSLQPVYKKVAFSFMIPTLIFLGVLYASVSARFVFFRIFHNSRHKSENTVLGWSVWAGILLATWILAFIIANVIPFFSDLLSLMSSLFDSFFGFIFWGVAYFRMRKADGKIALVKDHSITGYLLGALNIVIILIGILFVTVGTYASVESIIIDYDPATGGVFSCASNGL